MNSRPLYAILPPVSVLPLQEHLVSESDEGFWLEKRDGRRFHKPKVIQQAEVLESDPITAKIVFHDPIPRGEYNLIVSTRCGDGRDYAHRRIGHPITVP